MADIPYKNFKTYPAIEIDTIDPEKHYPVVKIAGSAGESSSTATQAEHFTTANNLLNETLSAYILRVYPSAVIANITSVVITLNSSSAIITSAAGTITLGNKDSIAFGNGSKKLNNLSAISLGAVKSFTVAWSEDNA